MSAISPTLFDWSRQGAELSNDCETFKLFGEFGDITSFNLYRRWAKAKNSKGCGTVVYADKVSAAAALAALDGKQAWPESETPMVVEWAQAGKIRPAPADDAAAVAGCPSTAAAAALCPACWSLSPVSWLELQQVDEQSALIAATAAAAAAGDPMGLSGSSFAGCAGSSTHAGGPALAAPAAAPLQEVNLDLNPQAARKLVGSLTFVKDRTGAEVIVNCSATGLQLRLRGSCSQIESACGILRLLLL
ncbi:hypothetical protein COO60DRAFT_1694322 [Scenedesmus sp. NREL 46B-D3]|nr:hypothetical protein COO60DRAFT_1694322 [Scenedesmus sp. NREL 46B-D3]